MTRQRQSRLGQLYTSLTLGQLEGMYIERYLAFLKAAQQAREDRERSLIQLGIVARLLRADQHALAPLEHTAELLFEAGDP